ncbi:MAG: tRNA pseudouridine(38-40) synthase TruA [Waddliaceae bacterium]
MKYILKITYDGTAYSGWQVQPNAVTIQEVLQTQMEKFLRQPIHLKGSGRTDAGVHALGQVAHFELDREFDLLTLKRSLNSLLPHDIRILQVSRVSPDFEARFSARKKIYHYHLWTEQVSSPFRRLYSYQLLAPIDIEKMREGAKLFLGTHDFTTFSNVSGGNKRNPIRSIDRLDIIPQEGGYRLEFEGPGFLYKMVRNICGVLFEIGKGKLEVDSIPALLEKKDRRAIGLPAPARGLFLMHVDYPSELIFDIDS